MIDLDDNRLEIAKSLGATTLINSSEGNAVQRVLELTARSKVGPLSTIGS
jgi:alcohol dehydrogenase